MTTELWEIVLFCFCSNIFLIQNTWYSHLLHSVLKSFEFLKWFVKIFTRYEKTYRSQQGNHTEQVRFVTLAADTEIQTSCLIFILCYFVCILVTWVNSCFFMIKVEYVIGVVKWKTFDKTPFRKWITDLNLIGYSSLYLGFVEFI